MTNTLNPQLVLKQRTAGGRPGPQHVMNPALDWLSLCGRKIAGANVKTVRIDEAALPPNVYTSALCFKCQQHRLRGTRAAWSSR